MSTEYWKKTTNNNNNSPGTGRILLVYWSSQYFFRFFLFLKSFFCLVFIIFLCAFLFFVSLFCIYGLLVYSSSLYRSCALFLVSPFGDRLCCRSNCDGSIGRDFCQWYFLNFSSIDLIKLTFAPTDFDRQSGCVFFVHSNSYHLLLDDLVLVLIMLALCWIELFCIVHVWLWALFKWYEFSFETNLMCYEFQIQLNRPKMLYVQCAL